MSSGTGAATTLCRRTLVPRKHGDNYCADQIQAALSGSEEDLRAFLVSNELWGGAGSIADQALVELGRPVRREAEAVLADIGEMQTDIGIANVRTQMWTSAFRQWQRDRI